MKKFELVLLVMLLIHSFSVMIEAKQLLKLKVIGLYKELLLTPNGLKCMWMMKAKDFVLILKTVLLL